jgi:hypothetical protein
MEKRNSLNMNATWSQLSAKIEVGKTYLDIWGRKHLIAGFIKDSNKIVYSVGGYWFDVKTGKVGKETNGHHLVNLPPKKELAFWRERIKQIESVNSADKLKLVKEGLDAMRERIKELETQND